MTTTRPTPASRRKPPPKATTTPPASSPAAPRAEPGAAADSGAADRPVTLAVVSGAHGVAGEVKLKLFTDDLSPYRSFNGGALTLRSLRGLIARFAEVVDRDAAEALRGTALTVPRSSLPPLEDGEYYHADLIGLPVVTPAGEPVGEVVAVENFGAGDLVEIARPEGRPVLVPLRPEAVPHWDENGMVVEPAFLEA